MYFRNHTQNRLEAAQGKLKHMVYFLNNNKPQEIYKVIEECNEIIEDLKSVIDREPKTPNEYNKV